MKKSKTVVIFGSTGLVGSGIKEALSASSEFTQILSPTHGEIDLMNIESVTKYLSKIQPDVVIMAAGQVGGILFNSAAQQEQFNSNFFMNFNVIEACLSSRIRNFYLISSSCIYPEHASTPMQESEIFHGLPHPTNEGYAIAKSAAVRQVLLYRRIHGLNWKVVVPTNIYGINDKFNKRAHVIPQLILKVNESLKMKNRQITVAGDGSPIREFLLNSELGNAIRKFIEEESDFELLNVSSGEPLTISNLVEMVCDIFEFEGEVYFDESLPNGHPNKTLDITRQKSIGWNNSVKLRDGLERVIHNFLQSRKYMHNVNEGVI